MEDYVEWKTEIIDSINRLSKSTLFQLSLFLMELYYSNFIYWLLENYKNLES